MAVIQESKFIPYHALQFSEAEMLQRSREFYDFLDQRRTVRAFSDKPVPKELIENVLMAASTAPSGAHKQPWIFCAVSNQDIKSEIRKAAEEEEYTNYNGRMGEEWLEDLLPFATDWHKPFLEIAPYLIIVFKKSYELVNGKKQKCYYVQESVGLACGMLLAAIHHAGLVALTHTPSPMNFLQKILNRPENEKPFLLIPVGYPAEGVQVPDLQRKEKEKIIYYY